MELKDTYQSIQSKPTKSTKLTKPTSQMQHPLIFKAKPLSISTCTVITNLNSKVNLGLVSRFINVYDQYDSELDKKAGGVYNLEYYGNCARGETLIDKIKDEFNNQATIKIKYWGFRNVNVKIFANGKLQMTGLKAEEEAKVTANILINILNNIKITLTTDITKLVDIPKTYDFQLVYDPSSNNVFYYRKYYDRFLKDYEFDTDTLFQNTTKQSNPTNSHSNTHANTHATNTNPTNPKAPPTPTVNFNRKGYIKGIHDVYNINADIIEEKYQSFLKDSDWNGDSYIRKTIEKIEKIKDHFTYELEQTLTNAKTLIDVKQGIDSLIKTYTDFKFPILDKMLSDISKNMYSMDDQTLIDTKHEIFKFHKVYRNFLEKKINRLVSIRTIDITICNAVKQYMMQKNMQIQTTLNPTPNTIESIPTSTSTITNPTSTISLEELEIGINSIAEPHNYFVSDTETVLINSDFSINHNINLKKMSKILRKMGLFNSYEPDDYPGVLTKYYYNDGTPNSSKASAKASTTNATNAPNAPNTSNTPTPNKPNTSTGNKIQGICNCPVHCSTKEKHSICTKITISVFRPGSVIITGARNISQLLIAHELILKVLKENLEYIKGSDNDDDFKQIALMNNEFRKISRKPRLFFFKKDNIINYDKIVE